MINLIAIYLHALQSVGDTRPTLFPLSRAINKNNYEAKSDALDALVLCIKNDTNDTLAEGFALC